MMTLYMNQSQTFGTYLLNLVRYSITQIWLIIDSYRLVKILAESLHHHASVLRQHSFFYYREYLVVKSVIESIIIPNTTLLSTKNTVIGKI